MISLLNVYLLEEVKKCEIEEILGQYADTDTADEGNYEC